MSADNQFDGLVCVDCSVVYAWDESPSSLRCVICFDRYASFHGWPDSADLVALGWTLW